MFRKVFLSIVLLITILCYSNCKKFDPNNKPDWAKKDIRDFSDVDLERLLDQWEEDEEPLEPDELPEHLRPRPKFDVSQLSDSDPEAILKASKKGRSLMAFVTVSGNPSAKETEDITTLWQASLMNNHITTDRYPIGSDRVIFMFKDGSQAWEARDFLVEQKRLEVMVFESKEYYGKYSSKKGNKSKKKEEL